MARQVTVHILEFFVGMNTRIEIVLEYYDIELDMTYYYRINQSSNPKKKFYQDDNDCLEALQSASWKTKMSARLQLADVVTKWSKFYSQNCQSILKNNCADAAAWFLNEFLGIKNPGSCGRPVTCDYTFCGLFAPSFLQFVTLPARVHKYAKHHLHNQSENDNQVAHIKME